MEELIDVLDSNGNKTNVVKTKSEIKKDGDFHRAISVCIINSQNEILMQQRSSNKKVYPSLWSVFVKGHVKSGESSLEACQREIYEEIGVLIEPNELKYIYTIKEHIVTNENYVENIFFDTFLLEKDIKLCDVKLQIEEVSDAKYMYYKDVSDLINNSCIVVPNENDYKILFPLIDNLPEDKEIIYQKEYLSNIKKNK